MVFVVKNDGFCCAFCGEMNPPAPSTCRDHCRKCLVSLHVDRDYPGDRKSSCHGKMIPVAVLPGNKKSDFVLLFRCVKCKTERKNRLAPDDDFSALEIISEQLSKFG